jgi:hypothetical protein
LRYVPARRGRQMLRYAAEVVGLISVVLLCIAIPLTAVGMMVDVLVNTLRQKRGVRGAAPTVQAE